MKMIVDYMYMGFRDIANHDWKFYTTLFYVHGEILLSIIAPSFEQAVERFAIHTLFHYFYDPLGILWSAAEPTLTAVSSAS